MAGRSYTRRPSAEAPPAPEMVDLLNEALTAPGRMSDTYSRFYEYSYGNQLWLMQQGAREPIASYNGWKKLGRQVIKGASAFYVLRPITVKSKTEVDEKGQPKTYTKFKPVKGAFPYSMTEGDELPEVEPREWDKARALKTLDINEVPFQMIRGNIQGYSYDRNVAVSPVAAEPLPTLFHELGHVCADHTKRALGAVALSEVMHEGLMEFEAESTNYLLCNELDVAFNREESRAYIQNWLRGDTPPDSSIRKVFRIVDLIRRAGYASQEQELEAAS